MRYWAEHPEKYDELIREGILQWVDNLMSTAGFETPGEWLEGYRALIEVLQNSTVAHDIYEHLLSHANKTIIKAEQDYWGSLVDGAKEKAEQDHWASVRKKAIERQVK